jgi:lysozyme
MNIVDGPYRGGNYWSDYKGTDLDGDRLGDTLLPYNCSGRIKNGGDYHPLVKIIKGIDVSHHQGNINWSKVYNSGYVFAFVKATEGVGWTDKNFTTNMNEGRDAGMLMGAYHFATPYTKGKNDAVAEAQYFVNKSRGYLESGYLRPALDLEDLEYIKGYKRPDKKRLSRWVHEWMNTVKNATGVEPILYVNSNYAKNYLNESVNKYDLWIANYGCDPDKPPDTKACGIWADWDFLQYTEKGSVPGISGNVDLDIFNVNRSRLNTVIIKKTVKVDLWVEEIKIIQTVEDTESDYFVASKPAVVRVFVNGSINTTKEEVVNTKLKLMLDGKEIETKDVTVKEQRWYSLRDQKRGLNSINFYIPSKYFATEGAHKVEAIINPDNNPPEANESNNRKTKACNVKKTPKDIFEVEFVALNVGEWDNMNATELQSYNASATANSNFLRAVYPLSVDSYKAHIGTPYDPLLKGKRSIALRLWRRASTNNNIDRVVGICPRGWLGGATGLSFGEGETVVFVEEGTKLYWVSSHEIMHTFGKYCGKKEDYMVNPPHGSLADDGWWVDRRLSRINLNKIDRANLNDEVGEGVYGSHIFSYMGNMGNATPLVHWTTKADYKFLYGKLVSSTTTSSLEYYVDLKASNSPGKLILLSGLIWRNGTVTIDPIYSDDFLDPEEEEAISSNYYLEFYQDTSLLKTYRFDTIEFTDSLEIQDGFVVTVEMPESTTAIYIKRNDGTTIATLSPSDNVPSVELTYPNGGELLTGDVEVTWNAEDVDGDSLTYILYFRDDSGLTWRTIAMDIEGSSYHWDSSDYPGSDSCMLKIVASDGFNSAEDRTDSVFSLSDKAPFVAIINPENNSIFEKDEEIYFYGIAYDPQGNTLDYSDFIWTSDIDGYIGTGSTLSLSILSSGTHEIKLKVENSAGLTGTSESKFITVSDIVLPDLTLTSDDIRVIHSPPNSTPSTQQEQTTHTKDIYKPKTDLNTIENLIYLPTVNPNQTFRVTEDTNYSFSTTTYSSTGIRWDLRINADTTEVPELTVVKLTVMGVPGMNIQVKSDPVSDNAYFPGGLNDNPKETTNEFDDVIDSDGIGIYAVEFNDTGTYTIKVLDKNDPSTYTDTVDITVTDKAVIFDVPDIVIIGERFTIKGTANTGDTVTIAVEDEVVQKLEALVIAENGEFKVEIDTSAGDAPAAFKIPGSVRVRAYIGRPKASSYPDTIGTFEKEDGAIAVLMTIGELTAELSTNAVAQGYDFTITGYAKGSKSVDILIVAPEGFSGSNIEGGREMYHSSTSVTTSDDSFYKKISVGDDVDTGAYLVMVLSPGSDGVWGKSGYPILYNSSNPADPNSALGQYTLDTMTQEEVLDVVEGSTYLCDDLLWIDLKDVESSYVLPATISATIHNIGTADASNIVVQFFDGNPDAGGTQIGTDRKISSIAQDSSGTVQVTWTAIPGTHDIFVRVDPYNTIQEAKEDNNQAYKQITIGGAKTIYVDDDFTDDPANHRWDTIQEGINDADDGDTVLVYNGTYTETVTLNKTLTLTGEEMPTIDAHGSGDAIKITADKTAPSKDSVVSMLIIRG